MSSAPPPHSTRDPKRKFDAKVQVKCFSEEKADFESIVARDRLDGAEILRELIRAFVRRFQHEPARFPLVVSPQPPSAPAVVPIPAEHRFTAAAHAPAPPPPPRSRARHRRRGGKP